MFGLLKGLSVTLSQIPKKKYTLMYPEQKPEWPNRFRGIHKFYPELCIVCNQCARICPTSCISLSGSRGEDKKLHIETYDINFEICILCDLCTEVCPTEAIQMSDTFELAEYNRDALYKTIDWLTENGKQYDKRKGYDQDTPGDEFAAQFTPAMLSNSRTLRGSTTPVAAGGAKAEGAAKPAAKPAAESKPAETPQNQAEKAGDAE
ncbi:hypothetical protein skT53_27170 [Effusibacillus dendaii]|uniref:4Fe-4S ferredoxin-type domain-containing protein n=1 Tax=Effusibacillus dendaii TaxID=2743772 RepID=A0A7I8DEL9_9BACL|nr:hypothetical protein skT53_27170 [Effusibacillus dendaii]